VNTAHNKIWDFEKVSKIANCYSDKKTFKKENKSAYDFCVGNKLLDKVCAHMDIIYNKWLIEEVRELAKQYATKKDFENNCLSAYQWAIRNKKINEICSHMKNMKSKWDKKSAIKEARKYKTRKDFKKYENSAYKWCMNNNILDIASSHMKILRTKWNVEKIIKLAKDYETRVEFKKENFGAYSWCIKNNEINNKEIFGHMKYGNRGFDASKPAILYYLKINNGEAYKIGITNHTIEYRFSKEDLQKIEIVKTWYFKYGLEAYSKEQKILNDFKYAKYNGNNLLKNGNTELLRYDILNIDERN